MGLIGRIATRLQDYNDSGLSVVVDGVRLYHRGSQIKINKEGKVFTLHSSSDVKIEELDPEVFGKHISHATKELREVCVASNLPFNFADESINIRIDDNMKLIMLETEYFSYVIRSLKQDENCYIKLHGETIQRERLDSLLNAARPIILKRYASFIYDNKARPCYDLKKAKRFFAESQDIFTPVFIKCEPFPELVQLYPHLKQTKLYKMAVEKNRVVSTSRYSAYMLTQREMCEALGLHKFIRMKPEHWGRIFLGSAVMAESSESPLYYVFPNNNDMVMHSTQASANSTFNAQYKLDVYQKKLQEYVNTSLYDTLLSYSKISTLHAFCYTISSYLKTHRMPCDSLSELKPDALYSILSTINLY